MVMTVEVEDYFHASASCTTHLGHHVGIGTTMHKLRTVMTDFSFRPIAQLRDARSRSEIGTPGRLAHAK